MLYVPISPLVICLPGYLIFLTNITNAVTSPFMFMNEIEFCSNFYRYPLPSRSVTYVGWLPVTHVSWSDPLLSAGKIDATLNSQMFGF